MRTAVLAIISFALAFVLAFSQNQTLAEIKTSAVCEHCKERIESNLKNVEGILKADLNLETKVLSVAYDSTKISLQEIRKKISRIGYDADDVKRDPKAYKKLPKCCRIDG
ncbi:heavy-metal-associated domain-containing protein [Bacteroidetes/Chlorobi group bacterium Naka2016]|jgi:copper chaperone CopZ|nr:MAG: heavy-metal-associated domain-containing protein [Bacteroidetes/Chlorobi group bacterium Naka2016]